LPPSAAGIAFQNKQMVYALLMRGGSRRSSTLAARCLAARIGLIAVLHSWDQTLLVDQIGPLHDSTYLSQNRA
jgi:hypothetical protein